MGCGQGILAARLDEGDVHRAGCPSLGCKLLLPTSHAQAMLAPAQWERFERLLAQNYIDNNPHLKWSALVPIVLAVMPCSLVYAGDTAKSLHIMSLHAGCGST